MENLNVEVSSVEFKKAIDNICALGGEIAILHKKGCISNDQKTAFQNNLNEVDLTCRKVWHQILKQL
jgi:hypothetical protein